MARARKGKATAQFRYAGTLLGGTLLGGILLGGTVLLGVPAQAAGLDVGHGSSSVQVLVGPNRTTGVKVDTGADAQPDAQTGTQTGTQAGTQEGAPAGDQPGPGSGSVASPAAAVGASTGTAVPADDPGPGTPSSASGVQSGVQAGVGAGVTAHPRIEGKDAGGSKDSAVSSSGRGPVGHVRSSSERPVVELEQGTTEDDLKASGRPVGFWWAWLLFVVPTGTATAWWVRRGRAERLTSTGPLYS